METVVQAIVLTVNDYRDNDKILTVMTAKEKLRIVAKGVKQQKAKMRAFAQPFAFGEFTCHIGDSGELAILTGGAMTDSFFELTTVPEKYFAGCFLLEVAEKSTEFQSDCAEIFLDTLRALRQLTYSHTPPCAVVIKYILKVMGDMGYRQRVVKCSRCGATPRIPYYDARNGGLQCELCRTGRKMPYALFSDMKFVATSEWDDLDGKEVVSGSATAVFLAKELEWMLDAKFKTIETLA